MPGTWADPNVPQVEGNGQPPPSFQQVEQHKDPSLHPQPPIQSSVSIYLEWRDQLRSHPKLRSTLSANLLHLPFYLGALAGRTLQGVEPGNAWCGKRSKAAAPGVWQTLLVRSACPGMPSDAQLRSRQPHL